jgi:hypothetical protein
VTAQERHDAREADMAYWGLDWRQQVSYLGRLSQALGRRAAREAEKSESLLVKAVVCFVGCMVLLSIALLVGVLG